MAAAPFDNNSRRFIAVQRSAVSTLERTEEATFAFIRDSGSIFFHVLHVVSMLKLKLVVEATLPVVCELLRRGPLKLRRITADVNHSLPADRRNKALAISLIAELTVSKVFKVVPKDEAVMPAVRSTIEMHYRDEARHRTFFRAFLASWWPGLSAEDRLRTANDIAHYAAMVLEPDIEGWRQQLRPFELDSDTEARVVGEHHLSLPALHERAADLMEELRIGGVLEPIRRPPFLERGLLRE